MVFLHCVSRPLRTASLPSSLRIEKLCFCTEELGSESISIPSTSGAASHMPVETVVQAGVVSAGSQGLHGSLQKEASNNEYFNVSNSDHSCMLQRARGLREALPMDHIDDAICSSSQCTDVSLQRYSTSGLAGAAAVCAGRTFPPPICSLVSDRQVMRTCKFNGRFVMRRISGMDSSPFCAIRENGRLKLIAASPSSSGELDEYANQAEETVTEEEAKERDSTSVAHKNFAVIKPNLTEEGKVYSAAYSNISLWGPMCRSHVKLVGPWDTAILEEHYLPALRLLLLTTAAGGAHRTRCRPYRQYSRWESTSVSAKGKGQSEGKLGSHNVMSSDLYHEGPINIAAQSAQGISASSIDEPNSIKKKVALEAFKSQGKQGYAIIAMKIGLLNLVLEIRNKGPLVLQARGVFFPSALSSDFAFNHVLKPRLEPNCPLVSYC